MGKKEILKVYQDYREELEYKGLDTTSIDALIEETKAEIEEILSKLNEGI